MIEKCAALEREKGIETTLLGVDSQGRLDPDSLREAIRPGETAMVSMIWGNNETGVPLAGAGMRCHRR